MTGELVFEHDGKGALLRWRGEASGADLKTLRARMYAADTQQRLRYQVWDFTAADELLMASGSARELALQDHAASRFNPGQRIALVGSDAVFNGQDRLYQIYTSVWSGYSCMTFRTIGHAREWLAGSDGPVVQPRPLDLPPQEAGAAAPDQPDSSDALNL